MILGLPWIRVMNSKCPLFMAYSIGSFMELSLFHVVAFMVTFSNNSFQSVVMYYSALLIVACIACLVFSLWKRRAKPLPRREIGGILRELGWREWIVLTALLVTIGFQLYKSRQYDITYMSLDDSHYTAIAADALHSGQIGTIDSYTGEAGALYVQRGIQTSLIFPAYLARISGLSVATVEHTVQHLQFILLAYIISYCLSCEIFDKRIDRLCFMLMVSVFYIFGYHSHYSLTFRMLGPNYQGKAVLAVCFTPLMLNIMLKKLSEPYQWTAGLLLFLLSLAAVSLSLWGVGTIIALIVLPVIIFLARRDRDWRHLLYVLWGCAAPAGFAALGLLYRLAV